MQQTSVVAGLFPDLTWHDTVVYTHPCTAVHTIPLLSWRWVAATRQWCLLWY